jgi:hypothetical protein
MQQSVILLRSSAACFRCYAGRLRLPGCGHAVQQQATIACTPENEKCPIDAATKAPDGYARNHPSGLLINSAGPGHRATPRTMPLSINATVQASATEMTSAAPLPGFHHHEKPSAVFAPCFSTVLSITVNADNSVDSEKGESQVRKRYRKWLAWNYLSARVK